MAENDEEQAQGPRREKLYDGRFLNRLKTLEKESEFGDWAFVLRSHCGMVDERVGTLMDLSLQRDDPLAMSVNPEERRVQTELYHLMILTTVGASMRIVRQVEVGMKRAVRDRWHQHPAVLQLERRIVAQHQVVCFSLVASAESSPGIKL